MLDLPEHYYLDAFFFRRAIAGILNDGVAAGIWTDRDAARLARMFTSQNALRAYDLPTRPTSAQGASG
ncbi:MULTISPECIES: hypothetical protein [Thermomonospora]|uniref:Uncharacterized protein n=1 Tax=Thermomonospora cellulosilytica TaxID=1411118 RepID=A0A7W3R6W8_9ACTN|nr:MULTISPECIES: hypothetical protein [Thermomonospora]MBA9002653.1 hypothetical protein [Thermomonospora cellulosilytica]